MTETHGLTIDIDRVLQLFTDLTRLTRVRLSQNKNKSVVNTLLELCGLVLVVILNCLCVIFLMVNLQSKVSCNLLYVT